MRLITRLLSVTAFTTVVVVALAAAPASAATIDVGHIDFLDVDLSGSTVTLDIKTYSPANDDLSPTGTTLKLLDLPESEITVPSGSAWACLGSSGATRYRFPQVQDLDLLWPGWNTEDVASGTTTITLVSVTPPAGGGQFTVYTVGATGTPTYKLNSNSATGCPKSTFTISAGTHGHANVAFSTEGEYKVTLRATVGASSSADIEYTFQIH
jgi:surface-anchored protein